jgi:mRNA-degrading endonuclease RelE of RelBE toxin-antitoxin system
MRLSIDSYEYTERFRQDWAKLDAGLKASAKDALDLLLKNPRAASLRFHALKGHGKPTIYKIDVTTSKSHQISFVLDGKRARLLRIGTHKEIDRDPK